ncbi:LTA synthase family protein [Aliarcobacter thereius]|uniref:LTA synthase family protein n=1 Tax=Aliarcobacter thereius TaxID=544718 RepID=UPI000827E590|nr:LTA synthase family protein [Aliarcobacter thereius]OCL94163.1 Lipoteichoic acid synthase 1 [Aliarcobacter thereius]
MIKKIMNLEFKNRYTQIFFAVLLSLLILSFLRVFFYFKYQYFFEDLSNYEMIKSFIFGLRVDIITIFTFIGVLILLLSLPFKFTFNKYYKIFISILWSIFLISILVLCVADLIYFEFSQRHISNEILALANDMDIIFNMAFGSLLYYTITSVILFLLLTYVFLHIFKAPLKNEILVKKDYLYFLLIIVILFAGIRNSVDRKSFGIVDAYAVPKTSSGILAINGFYSFYRTLGVYQGAKRVKLMEFNEALPIAKGFLKSERFIFKNEDYPAQRILNNNDKKEKYNIVIVLLESWGAEHIDGFTKYKELNVTPYFKKLSNESLRYTNFYANGYRSIYGITSIYTGITLPKGFQYLGNGLELTNFSYLGQIAKENGYTTIAAQSSNRRSYRVDAVSLLAGFEEFYGAEDMPNIEIVDKGRKPDTGTYDYNMFDFMHKKLNNLQEPFLSFMFTSTNHSDFHLPSSKFERYPHDLKNYNGYLNSLIYVDNAIERFMESVKKEPWFDNTIFIFTSDHGSGNALGNIGKELRPNDKEFSSIEGYRIPLLIYAPKIFKAKTIETLGSQNDIKPTIIDILGFKNSFSVMGNSLFDETVQNRFVYTFGGDQIALIKDNCYILFNYKNVTNSNCTDESKNILEKELRAIDSFEVELLDKNRWSNSKNR